MDINSKQTSSMAAEEHSSSSSTCFFCAVNEPDTLLRRSLLSSFFRAMPTRDDPENVLVMSGLWSIAMSRPSDLSLPSLGALRCCSLLLSRSLSDLPWLRRHQNLFIPYYAAHVLGSYTIRFPTLASLAARSGAIPPLLSLLRGRLSWVEQRVAIRALGHLASFDSSFPAVARHRDDVVRLSIRLASTCLDTVYRDFIALPPHRRKRYHRDLLTRGLGGVEMEERKAEEWASQMQCWSLYLLCCFAWRDRSSRALICRDVDFLKNLGRMWGGLANADSPAGVGLMRILCRSAVGREAVAGCQEALESLCNLSRSSDDWQYMGIDCLLMLLDDSATRSKVMPVAAHCLSGLWELKELHGRRKLGDTITKSLLLDFTPDSISNGDVRKLWEMKVERKRRETAMTAEEMREKRVAAAKKKKEGNKRFWVGDVEGAVERYNEALELCPLRRRKERAVVYSNRAQCWLLLKDPDAAIGDATRALSLWNPANRHGKSLWRRAQAYDMKGMGRESLMDCVMFVSGWLEGKEGEGRRGKVPYYAACMINKQIRIAGLFAGVAKYEAAGGHGDGDEVRENKGTDLSLPTIAEEAWGRKREEEMQHQVNDTRN